MVAPYVSVTTPETVPWKVWPVADRVAMKAKEDISILFRNEASGGVS
jgi:hypothetical protein